MIDIFVLKNESSVRIAIKENNQLVECLLEEESKIPQIGEIYKGRIKNILPSINSIFIDIGLEKEAYMYYSEELKEQGIKKGQDILIEVLKEPLGNKGAKVTPKPALVGKNIVITLGGEGIKFSGRISSSEDRKRLVDIINPIKGIEVMFRTDSAQATEEEILNDFKMLINKKEILLNKLNYSSNIGKIYTNNLIQRFFSELDNVKTRVICNDNELLETIRDIVKDKEEILLEFYSDERDLFDNYGIEKEVLKLRHKKVNVPCGGYIIIDKTEAMYVIDVNSGKNIKGKDFNKTIFQTNIEAAREIGKQIRLRNLSGIILVDFIDMRDIKQKPKVLAELKKSLKSDKGNVKVFPFTELDLVQISRKRKGKSIYEYLEEPCKKCKANGFLLKLSYIEKLLSSEILKCSMENSINDFYIELDENYREQVEEDLFGFLNAIGAIDKEIYLNFVHDIEGYNIEPLIFSKQKENYQIYKIKTN